MFDRLLLMLKTLINLEQWIKSINNSFFYITAANSIQDRRTHQLLYKKIAFPKYGTYTPLAKLNYQALLGKMCPHSFLREVKARLLRAAKIEPAHLL